MGTPLRMAQREEEVVNIPRPPLEYYLLLQGVHRSQRLAVGSQWAKSAFWAVGPQWVGYRPP